MERQEKDYIFRVYRTVQQSVLVFVTSDREADAKELAHLANKAEYQAGGLPDSDWKVEGVDTMYAIYEEYAKKE